MSRVRRTLAFRWYVRLVGFSILGSALSKATSLDPGLIAPVASILTLTLAVACVARPILASAGRIGWLVLAAILAIGATAEIVGLYTGWPFGAYEYTGRWLPSLTLPGGRSFPAALPFAWLMMAAGGYLAALKLGAGKAAPVAGALLATLADLAIEPAATGPLGYWTWSESQPVSGWLGAAPLLNYAGWLLTSLMAGGVLSLAGVRKCEDPEPGLVLALHVGLMAALWLLR